MVHAPSRLTSALCVVCALLLPQLSTGQALSYDWAVAFTGTANNFVTHQAVGGDGSLYLQGSTNGPMDLNPGAGTVSFTNSAYDIFLVKLSADGVYQWGHGLNSPGDDYPDALMMLANGDLLQVFHFTGTMDMDPGPGSAPLTSVGGDDIGLRRLSPSGALIWAKRLGGTGGEDPEGVYETPEGDLVLVGAFSGITTLDPAGVQGVHNAGGPSGATLNMFMVKLDATGNYLWSVAAGGEQHDRYSGVQGLPNGNLLVHGLVEYEQADVDPGPAEYIIDPGQGRHGVLLEFDPDGAVVSIREIASSDRADIANVLVTPDGEVLVLGKCFGDVTFGPGTPTLVGSNAPYLAKYAADGSFLWAQGFTGASHQSIAMTFDQQGNVLFGGWLIGTMDADPGPGTAFITSAGGTDGFLVKLGADGTYRWAHRYGSSGSDQVRSIHVAADGAITLAGVFSGTVDMDPGTEVHDLVGADGFEGCVLRYQVASCADLLYQVDALDPVLCEQLGSVQGTVIGGVAPYTVTWNTTPPQNGTTLSFAAPGTATVQVIDATGCEHGRTLVLPGTIYQSHDLTPVVVLSPLRVVDVVHVWVDAVNGGCVPVDAELRVVLPEEVNYMGAEPSPAAVLGDTLIWNYPQLEAAMPPLGVRIDITVPLATPINTGLCFQATLLPEAGDAVPENNHQVACGPVVNSYDPNDKQVIPAGRCEERYVPMDQVLRYAVRFQNTGNAPALRVVVVDSLSPLLDPASLRLIANSHPVVAEWMPGNVLRFVFDDIDLPDSTSNEPESHGHVVFELAPVAGHQEGDIVANEVGIYFDYNDPIITNAVHNTFTANVPTECLTVGVPAPEAQGVRLFPNPCTTACFIEHPDGHVLDRVVVFDAGGRVVASYTPQAAGPFRLPAPQRPGLYGAQVWYGGGMMVVRFVVE